MGVGRSTAAHAPGRPVSDERREADSPDESEDSPGFDIRDGPLARALDAGGIGLALIASASRQLLAANDAFCALCGYSADELRGLPLARLNHPDEPFDEAAFAALLASGSASGRQRRLAHRDGTVRWVLLSAQLLRGAGAEPPRIIAIVQDITAARLAQDALRSRERHLGFITGLNDALRGLDDPVALSFEAARRLGEFLGADRVGYAEDAGDGESVVVTRNFTRGVPASRAATVMITMARRCSRPFAPGAPWYGPTSRMTPISPTPRRQPMRYSGWVRPSTFRCSRAGACTRCSSSMHARRAPGRVPTWPCSRMLPSV